MFVGDRKVNTREWTWQDTQLAMALETFEAGLCPGGDHVLAETSKPEHADAYRPDKDHEVRCHKCKARALLDEVMAKDEDSVGVFVPLMLDLEVVARNLLPTPEPPTADELRIRAEEDAVRMGLDPADVE